LIKVDQNSHKPAGLYNARMGLGRY